MKFFQLKQEHVKLIRRMYVDWQDCETGAPEIDPKRPYGNSDVANDVADILGRKGKRYPHCDEQLDEELSKELLALHRETEQALQVVLSAGTFEPGHYQCDDYKTNWQRVAPE